MQGDAVNIRMHTYRIVSDSMLCYAVLCCPSGVTWKAQNQAAVLLAAGQKGHRYTFPHAKISTAPPIMNRVFGQTVDAQLQVRDDAATRVRLWPSGVAMFACAGGAADVVVYSGLSALVRARGSCCLLCTSWHILHTCCPLTLPDLPLLLLLCCVRSPLAPGE